MKIIIRILRTFKNILFPKIYMPWEQNDLDLDKVAHEAYQAHRIACENWDNGYINDIWLDDNKNICIRYDNGKWWHYSTNDGGQWTWW